MRYYSILEVEAEQWFKVGDHPAVTMHESCASVCKCGLPLTDHGMLGSLIVCPGDYVVMTGEHIFLVPPEHFEEEFVLAEDEIHGNVTCECCGKAHDAGQICPICYQRSLN